MLVYGDAARVEDPRDRLAALAEALGRIPGMAAGIARHAALVAVLIDAGELAQGLADEAAFVAAAGRQDRCPSPAQAAAMALLMRLARAVGASWESGFARLVPLPSPARIRSLAGRLHRGDAPAAPEAIVTRRAEGFAFYALYPEGYRAAALASGAYGRC